MLTRDYTILFGGQAGYGVMSAGAIVAKAAGRNGLYAYVVNEYPSLIKGGLNTCLVRLGESPVAAYDDEVDFLGALSPEAFLQGIGRVKPGGCVLYDADNVNPAPEMLPEGIRVIPVKLIQSVPGDAARVMANSAMLGAFQALTSFPAEVLAQAMEREFPLPEVAEKNVRLMHETAGRLTDLSGLPAAFPLTFRPDGVNRMFLNGNDAIAMGAIKAGLTFAAGYPMTPGSSVLTYLADHAAGAGLVFKQAEDEIAAINMIIGAGFAGARSLVATSGGGFALMAEALGFAAQAEIPVVIVLAQRGGPSTGLPTRTAQADLNFAVYASQGDFPRIVAAPGDVEECFIETARMLELAEKYQIPGIILTDKFLADSTVTQPFFDEGKIIPRRYLATPENLGRPSYKRYRLLPGGISPRAVPGQMGGRHIATSYTHGEDGFYSSGDGEFAPDEPRITAEGIDKLHAKIPAILADVPGIKSYGPPNADLTVVSWGSTKGAILEAMQRAAAIGHSVNFLQILYPCPFPAEAVRGALGHARAVLLIEGNKTAQLGGMLRLHTGIVPDHLFLKYDSRPFTAGDVTAKLMEVLK